VSTGGQYVRGARVPAGADGGGADPGGRCGRSATSGTGICEREVGAKSRIDSDSDQSASRR